MRRTALVAGALAVAACALLACNAILGIEAFPDVDAAAGAEGGVDAAVGADGGLDATTSDQASPDTSVDVTTTGDAGLDATADGPSDVRADTPISVPCLHPCVAGTGTCTDAGLVMCELSDAGCEIFLPPVTCGTGQSCWGAPSAALCCDGTAAGCAPSCRGVPGDGGLEGGPNGLTTCGLSRSDNCCTSLPVAGGTYERSYDGVFNTDGTSPATVSSFALDKYEVTVGRFRRFVTAWTQNWRPRLGAGIHTHLHGGQGLIDSSSDAGAYEPGWSTTWSTDLPDGQDPIVWLSALQCNGAASPWTATPGQNEDLPIACVDWYMAYAFCIWDGGFLPSEAEWDYAAAGGGATDGQRVYAWSSPHTSTTIDCTYANYQACGSVLTPVGLPSKGAGKWGQLDLTGNVWEWTLDSFATYVTPCNDCGNLGNATGKRSIRGASYSYPANQLYVATRVGDTDTILFGNDGIRCARPSP